MSYPNCNPLMRRAQANFPKVLSSGPNGRSEADLGPSLEHSGSILNLISTWAPAAAALGVRGPPAGVLLPLQLR